MQSQVEAYAQFLRAKAITDPATGLIGKTFDLPEMMFPFQHDVTAWALRRGRSALFAGCVAGETMIDLPEGRRTIRSLADAGDIIEVWSLNAVGQRVRAVASCPFRKGVADLFRFSLASGREIVVTGDHRFLTEGGWSFSSSVVAGDRLLVSDCDPRGSILELGRREFRLDARHCSETTRGCPDGYFSYRYRYGGPLHDDRDSGLFSSPSPIGADARILQQFYSGGLATTQEDTHHHPLARRLSMPDFDFPDSYASGALECRVQPSDQERTENCTHKFGQYQSNSVHSQHEREPRPLADGSIVAGLSLASGASFLDTVVGAQYIRTDEYFDMFVPGFENYLAEGIWHHNTGLGKTLMELAWGREIERETHRPILHFAPLAVSAQIVREAQKFGVPARLVASALDCEPGMICVTNYQKLQHFDVSDFGATILDESSILKSVDGHYRTELIDHCSSIPFRLAATATPAPNDFMELGNHAEFLGVMSYTDMLATFFVHDGGDTQKWRLKGHAEDEFWKWMASWAVMLRKPSDLGYSDEGYDLPPLVYHSHTVEKEHDPSATGTLFAIDARTLSERITARRDSVEDRVAKAIEITPTGRSFCWWTNLNSEAEMLAKGIGGVNLHGSLPEAEKERIILDFCDGKIERLVTKPSLMGFGINAQVCADTGFVGLNDSFEQFYQAVRRFWRFGQTKQVNCHIISAATEGATVANIRRKEADADRMAAAMIAHTRDLSALAVRGSVRDTPSYCPNMPVVLPTWL